MGMEHNHPVPGYQPAHEAPTRILWLPAVRYLVHEHARPGLRRVASWLVGDESCVRRRELSGC